jgi:hypothetical protein
MTVEDLMRELNWLITKGTDPKSVVQLCMMQTKSVILDQTDREAAYRLENPSPDFEEADYVYEAIDEHSKKRVLRIIP